MWIEGFSPKKIWLACVGLCFLGILASRVSIEEGTWGAAPLVKRWIAPPHTNTRGKVLVAPAAVPSDSRSESQKTPPKRTESDTDNSAKTSGAVTLHYIAADDLPAGDGDCYAEAAKHVQIAKDLIGPDGVGPVVIGGIGDSGTRGVQIFLSTLGVDMGYFRHPGLPNSVKYTYDSLVFMNGSDIKTCSTGEVLHRQNAHYMYTPILERLHTITYNQSVVADDDIWYGGLQVIAKITQIMHRQTIEDAKVDSTLHPRRIFGFKHPRTSLVLPFFHAAFDKQFKFVHVLRDGRDVANGRNRRMFTALCDDYFNKTCARSLVERLRFWAALNLEIYHWAKRNLGPDQYHVVRIEDLIDGDVGCMLQLAEFVGVGRDHFESRISPKFMASFGSHRGTYSGRKWSMQQATHFSNSVRHSPVVVEAFHTFGYTDDAVQPWKRRGVCLEQPFLRA